MSLAIQRVGIACFCAAALAAVGCADGSVNSVSPSPAVSSLAATRPELSPRLSQRPSSEGERSM